MPQVAFFSGQLARAPQRGRGKIFADEIHGATLLLPLSLRNTRQALGFSFSIRRRVVRKYLACSVQYFGPAASPTERLEVKRALGWSVRQQARIFSQRVCYTYSALGLKSRNPDDTRSKHCCIFTSLQHNRSLFLLYTMQMFTYIYSKAGGGQILFRQYILSHVNIHLIAS